MGVVENIRWDRWPRSGKHLGRRVKVRFHYDPKHTFVGTIVRGDAEEPHETIIRLVSPPPWYGRYVRAGECQYALLD